MAATAFLLLLAGYTLATAHPFPPALEGPCRVLSLAAGAASLVAGSIARRRIGARAVRVARLEALLGCVALGLAGATLAAEADRCARPLPVHPPAVRVMVTACVLEVDAATARTPSLLGEIRRVRVGSREAAARARVLLRFREPAAAPGWALPGLWFRAEGRYRPPEDARSPGGFAPGRWLEREGIEGAIEIDPASVTLLRGPEGGGSGFGTLAATARSRIGRAVEALLSAPSAALVRGMLLGDRAGIAPAVETAFRDGGTIHVLSISGLHVCILAALGAFVCAAARVPSGPSAAVELLLLWGYVAFVGAPVPAVRSAILWTVLRGARLVGRAARPFTAWGLAGVLILLADPGAPLDAGFQLSFAAVLGLLASAGLVPSADAPRGAGIRARLAAAGLGLASLAGQSLGAEAATLGFQISLFGAVPVAGVALNLLAVPLCSLFLAEAVLLTASLALVPPLAPWAAGAVDATGLALVAATRWTAARVPAVAVHSPAAPVAVAASIALLVLAAAAREGSRHDPRRPRAATRAVAVAALALALAIPLLAPSRPPSRGGALRLLAVDVGQGDGLLAILPEGEAVLFDAGPVSGARDAGQTAIEPALRAEGIRSLALVVLSHAHSDHYGGLAWLARRGWIRSLVENGSPRLASVRAGLRREVEARGGRWTAVDRDTTIFRGGGGTSLELLAGPRPLPAPGTANADENNRSIVAILRARGRVLLLPGDAEAGAERALAPRIAAAEVGRGIAASVGGGIGAGGGGGRRAFRFDLLKASHHGSATSSDSGWIAAARPRVAIISCGEGNRFGHPSPVTLGRLRLAGARVYRTDLEGAIRLTADGEGLWISSRAHPDPERIADVVELR